MTGCHTLDYYLPELGMAPAAMHYKYGLQLLYTLYIIQGFFTGTPGCISADLRQRRFT